MKALEDEQGTNLVIQGVHKNIHKLDKYCLKFHLRIILKDVTIEIFPLIWKLTVVQHFEYYALCTISGTITSRHILM